ncbi:MAG: DUF1223 domain-containing protein [Stellaceae bacterium]
MNLSSAGAAPSRSLVVVELFTSQGCSSCPPADAFLGRLAKRPDILALGFHVAYWNYIGWTDPYALKLAAARQRAYADRLGPSYIFTPEMVIDGRREGVGSEPPRIEALIEAERHLGGGPDLTLERRAGGGFHVHVGAAGAAGAATLWLVGIDRMVKTRIASGENAGKTATDFQVVRSFKAVGDWHGEPLDINLPAGDAIGDEAALLLEARGTGPILAAAKAIGPGS